MAETPGRMLSRPSMEKLDSRQSLCRPEVAYETASERLRKALERAKRSGPGDWDFLFEELRLARWEAGALAKAIRQVQEHLGVMRRKSDVSTRGGLTPRPPEEEEPEAEDGSQRQTASPRAPARQAASPQALTRKWSGFHRDAAGDEQDTARRRWQREDRSARRGPDDERPARDREPAPQPKQLEEEMERRIQQRQEAAEAEERQRVAEAKRLQWCALMEVVERVKDVDMACNISIATAKERLKAALAEARRGGLSEAELVDCERLVGRLVRASVANGVDVVRSVDRTSVDALRQAKDSLTVVIQEARLDGMPEEELMEAERIRRKIHNKIEDLKGSVRVFCRIRPMSRKERDEGEVPAVWAVDSMTLEVERELERNSTRSCSRQRQPSEPEVSTHQFGFDAVFNPGSQAEIFQDCRDLIQSVFDGYNATIFAYGQTGAGKTHTLLGSPEEPGLAPQLIREIFSLISRESDRFHHQVTAQMLELYRNELVDLLDDTVKKVSIRTDLERGVQMENALVVTCSNEGELSDVLLRGLMFRTTAATAMNSESSRSHLICTVTIVSVNRETGEEIWGKVQIVDLAGSERLKKSLAMGDRQKEAIDINRSLTALGDVIEALTQGHRAVPYRNHKLTQVLQDALGNSAKTLMFVNCAATRSNVDETLASLRYAARVKRVPGPPTPRGGDVAAQGSGAARPRASLSSGPSTSTPRLSCESCATTRDHHHDL